MLPFNIIKAIDTRKGDFKEYFKSYPEDRIKEDIVAYIIYPFHSL